MTTKDRYRLEIVEPALAGVNYIRCGDMIAAMIPFLEMNSNEKFFGPTEQNGPITDAKLSVSGDIRMPAMKLPPFSTLGSPVKMGIIGGQHLGKAAMIASLGIPSMESRNPLHWPLNDGESLADKIKKDILQKHGEAILVIENFEVLTAKQKEKK